MNTEYFVTYPKSTLVTTTGNSRISENTNVYNFVKQQRAFRLQLQSQTQKDYLRNVTVTKEYNRYDDSNNPQSIVTKCDNSFTETQEIKYIRKGSWCANKIEKITTTKSRTGVPNDIRTQEYTYDGKGNLLTKTTDPNTSFTASTIYSNYDKYGNPGLITLRAGNESRSTSLAYSSTGRFITRKTNNLLNETVTYNYDESRSLLLSETSRLGTTTYAYDGFGRQTKVVSPDKVESVKLLKWASTGSMAGSKFYEYTETSSGKPGRIPNVAQTVTYTDFKKVKSISLGNKSLVLDYGVDEQRRKGVFKDGSTTFTRYYSGNYEEEVDLSGKVKQIHYISDGNGLAGIYINDDGNRSFYSAYCDYQGSLLALTDMNGVVKEKYAYDPWGNRRNPASWKDAETRTKLIIDRGYTLHEHLDGFGLINMNGRVYDPLLGMFLSPDPYVQAPGNWLNYNRYGYCYGNPLVYTDPNGEFFIGAIIIGAMMNAAIQGFSGNLHGGVGDFFKAAGIGALSGAAGASNILGTVGFVSGAINGAMGGFASGMVSGTGNAWMNGDSFGQGLKTGLIGGAMGGASGVLVGGLANGIIAFRHGGNFWSGKGTTFINEMVASANDDLGGKYFQDDITMKSYIGSKNGWTEGKYGVDDISVEKSPGEYRRYFYNREDGVLNKMQLDGSGPMVRVNGVTVNHQPNFFASNNTIYLSSRSSLAAFTETLNHELIHAYHHSLGLPSMLGRNFHAATENSAYTYTLLHTTSSAGYSSALRQLNKYPRPYILSWPKFLIPIP